MNAKLLAIFVTLVVSICFLFKLTEIRRCAVEESYGEMLRVYTEQGIRRAEEFKAINNVAEDVQFQLLYNAIVPEVFCPSLIRVGRVGDGGKWMCRPHALPNNCAIYSLGVNSETSFEHEIQSITNKRCKLYAFDKAQASDASIKDFAEINARFVKSLISDKTNEKTNEKTMASIMRENDDDVIEVLKIDIEGAEFNVMPLLLNSVNMCQILIELHKPPKDVLPLLRLFAKNRYRLFSYEINGKIHSLSEYSFIREDCLSSTKVRQNELRERNPSMHISGFTIFLSIAVLVLLILTFIQDKHIPLIGCNSTASETYHEMYKIYYEQGPQRSKLLREIMDKVHEEVQYQLLYNALVPENDPSELSISEFPNINAKFTKLFISDKENRTNNERVMASIMKENGDDAIEVLKIDIEGGEFNVMPQLMETIKMCQILMEVHKPPKDIVALFRQFSSNRYRLFSYELNGRYHNLSEYSFIREDCLERYNALPLYYYWNYV